MLASLKVKDYMVATKIYFTPDMDVLRAISQLIEFKLSGAPVLDKHGNMVGFLSEKDCMKVALNANYHGTVGGKVETFMGRGVETIDVNTPIIDVAQKFLDTPYKRFPVVNDNRLVGTITRHELLRALQEVAAPESTRKPANTQSTKQHIHVSSSS